MAYAIWTNAAGQVFVDPELMPGLSQNNLGHIFVDYAKTLGYIVEIDGKPYTTVAELQGIKGESIESAEAFGDTKIGRSLYAQSILSAESFSIDAIVELVEFVLLDSIPSAESFSEDAVITHVLKSISIESAELFGKPSISWQTLLADSILSAESFGLAKLQQHIDVESISSEETFGRALIIGGKTVDRGRRDILVRELAPHIAGFYGPFEPRTKAYVSNIAGEILGELPNVRGLKVDMANARDATWKLNLEMEANKDFNIFKDWVKVAVEVDLPDGTREYPYGLYKFTKPNASKNQLRTNWNLEGYSGEILFVNDTARQIFRVTKGTMVLATVRNLLLQRGVPAHMISLPMHLDVPTRADQLFDPFNDESKAARMRIMNALLNSAGFHALYTNRRGVFTTRKYTEVQNQDNAIKYGPNWPDEERILTGSVTDDWDDERFANCVIVTEETPPESGRSMITAVAENRDPNSAGSYDQIGFWRVKMIKFRSITSQADANLLARAQLQAASGYYRRATWTTPPDPDRREKEYAYLNVPDEVHPIEGRFKIDNLSFGAYPFPKEFSFSGSKLEHI